MNIQIPTLEDEAMLCRVKISFYSFRKYDSEASKVAIEEMEAETDAGRFNKSLIEREGIKFLRSSSNKIRRYHRRNTLPWNDEEYRILQSVYYTEFMTGLRDLITVFEKDVDDFCGTLPTLYEKAKKNLGKMWNPDDYLDPSDVREKYKVSVKVKPIPISGDFRVKKIDSALMDKIKKGIEDDKTEAINKAMANLWNRLKEPIKKMAEKLSDKDAGFRNSLVKNITEIVDLIPMLNLGDKNIEKFADDIRAKLCSVDPKTLREDNTLRKETAKVAKDILKKISAYC